MHCQQMSATCSTRRLSPNEWVSSLVHWRDVNSHKVCLSGTSLVQMFLVTYGYFLSKYYKGGCEHVFGDASEGLIIIEVMFVFYPTPMPRSCEISFSILKSEKNMWFTSIHTCWTGAGKRRRNVTNLFLILWHEHDYGDLQIIQIRRWYQIGIRCQNDILI